ncbi:MAG: hypothetical protein ACYS21_11570 [Planctomycetota bacterium]|jgi:hypothetical protein
MKKTGILVMAVMLLSAAGLAQAQEGELHGTVGLTYASRFIWGGFDYFADNHAVSMANADIDIMDTGVTFSSMWARPFSSGRENAETLTAGLSYSGNVNVMDDDSYATDYRVGWVYWGYPDERKQGSSSSNCQGADMQELFAVLSWPELCPAGWVPSYTIIALWPSRSNSAASGNSGWLHILGAAYDFTTAGLMPEAPEQIWHLSAEMVYNDGAAPGVVVNAPGIVNHDWSHALFGLSTNFDLGYDVTLTPAVYYQSSWEDTVNSSDEY